MTSGAGKTPTNWYMDIKGRKLGPYTIDQLHGFLEDGEIPEDQKVTCDELGGQWISIQEALRKYGANVADQTLPGLERPKHLDEGLDQTPAPFPARQDPLEDLFDALQTARKKQTAGTPTDEKEETTSFIDRVHSWRPALISVLGLVMAWYVWGLIDFLDDQSPTSRPAAVKPKPTAVEKKPPQRPSVRAVPAAKKITPRPAVTRAPVKPRVQPTRPAPAARAAPARQRRKQRPPPDRRDEYDDYDDEEELDDAEELDEEEDTKRRRKNRRPRDDEDEYEE